MKYIHVVATLFISGSLIGMEETEEGSGRWKFTHWSSEYQEVTHKVKNWHYRTIFLKGKSITELLDVHAALASVRITSLISFNPNPLS